MINEKFIILAVLIDLIGSGGYVIDTLKGNTKPNRVTWFLWFIIPAVTCAGMIAERADTTSIILTGIFGFIPIVVFLVSFISKKSFWAISRFDYLCGALSLTGLIGWLLTNDGNLAIIFSILADFLAAMPTILKSFKAPETESWLVYLNASIAASITLLTVRNWNFASIAFPIYAAATCFVLFALIKFKLGIRITRKQSLVS